MQAVRYFSLTVSLSLLPSAFVVVVRTKEADCLPACLLSTPLHVEWENLLQIIRLARVNASIVAAVYLLINKILPGSIWQLAKA